MLLTNPQFLITAGLLTVSNIFMTFAWYGHLKFKSTPLWILIFVSWGIAFFEYCFQVPANRIGATVASPSQLKVLQEVITFLVFIAFTTVYLKQAPSTSDFAAFALIILAVAVSFFRPFG
jgi:uncharacterized protein